MKTNLSENYRKRTFFCYAGKYGDRWYFMKEITVIDEYHFLWVNENWRKVWTVLLVNGECPYK